MAGCSFMKKERMHMPRTIKAGLEGHWLRVLDDFADSNCSVSQYCQKLNISKATLYKWSQRLGILLKRRSPAEEAPIDQKGMPSNPECVPPISFIELNVPCPTMAAPLPVKFELLLTQGRSLKIEAPSTWDGVIGLAKALVK
jgi:hypothetical protein